MAVQRLCGKRGWGEGHGGIWGRDRGRYTWHCYWIVPWSSVSDQFSVVFDCFRTIIGHIRLSSYNHRSYSAFSVQPSVVFGCFRMFIGRIWFSMCFVKSCTHLSGVLLSCRFSGRFHRLLCFTFVVVVVFVAVVVFIQVLCCWSSVKFILLSIHIMFHMRSIFLCQNWNSSWFPRSMDWGVI